MEEDIKKDIKSAPVAEKKPMGEKAPVQKVQRGAVAIGGLRTLQQDSSQVQNAAQPPEIDVAAILAQAKPIAEPVAPAEEGPIISRHTVSKIPPRKPLTPEEERAKAAAEAKVKAEAEEKARKEKEAVEQKKIDDERKRVEEIEAERVRKIQEAERLRREEEERATMLDRALAEITQKQAQAQSQLALLAQNKQPLIQQKELLLAKKKDIEAILFPIVEQKNTIDAQLKDVELKETSATSAEDRQVAEEQRWKLEDSRRKIEQEKWGVEEKLEEVMNKTAANDKSYADMEQQERSLTEGATRLQKEKEKNELQINLRELGKEKEIVELRWVELNDKKDALQAIIDPILVEEHGIEAQIKDSEQKESMATNVAERKQIESDRWVIEDKRRAIEKTRQDKEREMNALLSVINELKPRYQEILQKEEEAEAKLAVLRA